MNNKNRTNKYLSKITSFLTLLKKNTTVSTMVNLKSIYPLDNRVFYWLRDNGYIGLVDGIYKPLENITAKEVSKMLKTIINLSIKQRAKSKKTLVKPRRFRNQVNNVNVSEKKYDLILNVKLVVTSIEYKL